MIKAINRSIAARHEDDEKGFTLIELLVVILIIGVLAAIAIPAFLNQRQSAWESQMLSDISNASLAAESYSTAHNGKYADALDTDFPSIADADNTSLKEYGFNPTPDVTLTVALVDDGYTITAAHTSITDKTFIYTSETGVTNKEGAAPVVVD